MVLEVIGNANTAFENGAVMFKDFSSEPLFGGSWIIFYTDNIKNIMKNNINATGIGFVSVDFIDDDNEEYINKINRQKSPIQFLSIANDSWSISGTFTSNGNNCIYSSTLGSIIIASPYVLKVIKSSPRTLYMQSSEIGSLADTFDLTYGGLYSGSGIPVCIESAEWNSTVKNVKGTFRINFIEDKE